MVVLQVKPTKEENKHDLLLLLLLEPWPERVGQTHPEQETIKTLTLASVEAYKEFVVSLFSYYEAVTGVAKSCGEEKGPTETGASSRKSY